MDFEVTESPQDIIAAMSLAPGTTYAIQNIDPRGRIFMRIQVAAPVIGDRGNIISPGQFHYPTADLGEGIWLWCPDASGSVAFVVKAG